jgi:hypothetical protein
VLAGMVEADTQTEAHETFALARQADEIRAVAGFSRFDRYALSPIMESYG